MKPTKSVICEILGFCQLADAFALVEAHGDRVESTRLHPLDFKSLLKGHGILASLDQVGSAGEVGLLWDAKVFADPTFPSGLVHVKGDHHYATVATQAGLVEVLPKPTSWRKDV